MLLSPLSRASLGRAFAQGTSKFNFSQTQKRSARVWDLIFKDDRWFKAIDSLNYEFNPLPYPTLVGHGLTKLYYSSSTSAYTTSAYIALLVSDLGGDCQYLKKEFFASLREHDYDQEASEVRFKKSNIILNIRDAIDSPECIEMEDPRRLFRCHKQDLQTAVLYYKNENLIKIRPEKIGRVVNIPTKRKKCIENIYSL